MIKLILSATLIFIQFEGFASKVAKIDSCREYNIKSFNLINKFYIDGDTANLDSAIYYINKALSLSSCKKYQGLLSLRKLGVLSITRDYPHALTFIDSLNNNLYSDLPYFKDLLKNRFKAMEAQDKENKVMRDYYLKSILERLKNYLYRNNTKIDSLLKSPDVNKILGTSQATAITEYYYYRSILFGKEKIIDELLMRQKSKGINKEFYDYLISYLQEQNDFMIFNGI